MISYSLKPFQEETLNRLTSSSPSHVLTIAPTGSGKSLIYERFAVSSRNQRTLLITPLIALARQQYGRLSQIADVTLGTGPDGRIPNFDSKRPQVWVASPEKIFMNNKGLEYLDHWKPNFVCVDEAHCVFDWGDSFRPSFSNVPQIITRLNIKKSLWLTATFPHFKKSNLESSIGSPLKQVGNFQLPTTLELKVARSHPSSRISDLLSWIGVQNGAGIVFVQTRAQSTRIGNLLSHAGISAQSYHAGLSSEERKMIETKVSQEKIRVIVATSAFGMGMDFEHLKWTCLWQPPPSLLALTQAVGRVARGEQSGNALVLWDPADFQLLEWTLKGKKERREELLKVFQFLYDRQTCRESLLIRYFEDLASKNHECGRCDYCYQKRRRTNSTNRLSSREYNTKSPVNRSHALGRSA